LSAALSAASSAAASTNAEGTAAASGVVSEASGDDDEVPDLEELPLEEICPPPYAPAVRNNRRRNRNTPSEVAARNLPHLTLSLASTRVVHTDVPTHYIIPPLEQDSSNFSVWRFHITAALRILDLDDVLTVPCPDHSIESLGYQNWIQMDKQAYGIIIFSLTGTPACAIMYVRTAKDCLDKLSAIYEGRGASRFSTLMGKIFATPMTDTEPLGPQIDNIIKAAHSIAETGSPLVDTHVAYAIMMALPSSLELLKTILDSLSPIDQNPES
jgi:gag-polypeptide of LTR copia-type